MGIRDIGALVKISITKVLKVLRTGKYRIKPKRSRYDRLETGEFWTYVGEKGFEDGKKAEETGKTAWGKL